MFRELGALAGMWPRLRWSRDRLVDYQNRKLRKLLHHAYENVPYYRRLFDRVGLKPQDVRSVADLAAIPATSKSDIQDLPAEDRVARGIDPRQLIERHTGGSTGQPSVIRRTWMEERLLNAFRFRTHRLWGSRVGDRVAIVTMDPGRQASDRQILSKILWKTGLQQIADIDSRQPLPQLLERLERWQPDVIAGYPGAISLIAQAMIESGRRSIRPRYVVTGGEVQTPLMRRQIEEGFCVGVFDLYGCHEFNLVAWQCPQGGELHTCDDLLIAEVLRDNEAVAPGQRGEVVGTNLHAYASPIIRFRLEDVVTRQSGRCACGLPHDTIGGVQGRMLDYFPLPDGRLFDPLEIIGTVLHDRVLWLRQYQVLQPRRDLVVLRAVVSTMPSEERLREIRSQASGLLGGVEFRIEFASALELGAAGKFRVAHSMVRSRNDPFDWGRIAEDPARASN